MPDNTIDGTPDAVKVACPVWSGGKSSDYFKGLPITIKWVKISSQAVFKAGMSFTRVFHTEGMPISHLIQGGLVSHPYEGTCCRITLYPIGCAHDIFPRSD